MTTPTTSAPAAKYTPTTRASQATTWPSAPRHTGSNTRSRRARKTSSPAVARRRHLDPSRPRPPTLSDAARVKSEQRSPTPAARDGPSFRMAGRELLNADHLGSTATDADRPVFETPVSDGGRGGSVVRSRHEAKARVLGREAKGKAESVRTGQAKTREGGGIAGTSKGSAVAREVEHEETTEPEAESSGRKTSGSEVGMLAEGRHVRRACSRPASSFATNHQRPEWTDRGNVEPETASPVIAPPPKPPSATGSIDIAAGGYYETGAVHAVMPTASAEDDDDDLAVLVSPTRPRSLADLDPLIPRNTDPTAEGLAGPAARTCRATRHRARRFRSPPWSPEEKLSLVKHALLAGAPKRQSGWEGVVEQRSAAACQRHWK